MAGAVHWQRRHFLEGTVGMSNDVLSESDERIVRRLLAEELHIHYSVGMKIFGSSTLSEQVVPQDNQEFASIRRYRIALAPHKKLPPEVLCEIFLLCVGTDPTEVPATRYLSSIWVLSQVCSRWRAIALSDNRLWDRLSIRMRPVFTTHPPYELITEILSRSGHSVFSLHASLRSIKHEGPTDDRLLYQSVLPHSQRLHRLRLQIPSFRADPFTSFPPDAFSALVWLGLTFSGKSYHYNATQWEDTIITAFSLAPRLREVHLSATNVTISLAQFGIGLESYPWTQLTSFTTRNVNVPSSIAREFLHRAISLVTFDILLGADIPLTPFNPPTITNTNLSTLILRIEESATLGNFLRRLCLPNLQKFDVMVNSCSGLEREQIISWPQSRFFDMIQRSACILTEFHSLDWLIPANRIPMLVESMPHLKVFKVYTRTAISTAVLEKVRLQNQLADLEVVWLHVDSINAFLDLVACRWAPAKALGIREATFAFFGDTKRASADYERAESLKKNLLLDGKKLSWLP